MKTKAEAEAEKNAKFFKYIEEELEHEKKNMPQVTPLNLELMDKDIAKHLHLG